jgi:phytoene/squalene synthetase
MKKSMTPNRISGRGGAENLAAEITRSGSRQTYYTFLLLADRDRREQAFRSYAYFRWLDDQLDCTSGSRVEKIAFLKHQQELLEACYRREQPGEACPEEQMLVELVRDDREKSSGMQIYMRNMMAVMAFDVERCGRTITPDELHEYTRMLATAVTEVLFYLIGHNDPPPGGIPATMR